MFSTLLQEHVVSIVTNLLHKVPLASKSRSRVLSKFAEQECEKLDRLVELWSEYSEKIGPAADSLEPSLGEEAEEQYVITISLSLSQSRSHPWKSQILGGSTDG